MADKLPVKENAPALLRRQLAAMARKQHNPRYVFPASITLWGDDAIAATRYTLPAQIPFE